MLKAFMNGLMDDDLDARTKLNHGATFQMACGMSMFSIARQWFSRYLKILSFCLQRKWEGTDPLI